MLTLSVQSEKMGEFCAKQPVPGSFVRKKRSLIDWKPAAFTVLAQKCFHKMGRWQWVNIWAINKQVQLFCSSNSFHQPISSTSASIWLKYLSLQSWVNLGRYSNDWILRNLLPERIGLTFIPVDFSSLPNRALKLDRKKFADMAIKERHCLCMKIHWMKEI